MSWIYITDKQTISGVIEIYCNDNPTLDIYLSSRRFYLNYMIKTRVINLGGKIKHRLLQTGQQPIWHAEQNQLVRLTKGVNCNSYDANWLNRDLSERFN